MKRPPAKSVEDGVWRRGDGSSLKSRGGGRDELRGQGLGENGA